MWNVLPSIQQIYHQTNKVNEPTEQKCFDTELISSNASIKACFRFLAELRYIYKIINMLCFFRRSTLFDIWMAGWQSFQSFPIYANDNYSCLTFASITMFIDFRIHYNTKHITHFKHFWRKWNSWAKFHTEIFHMHMLITNKLLNCQKVERKNIDVHSVSFPRSNGTLYTSLTCKSEGGNSSDRI